MYGFCYYAYQPIGLKIFRPKPVFIMQRVYSSWMGMITVTSSCSVHVDATKFNERMAHLLQCTTKSMIKPIIHSVIVIKFPNAFQMSAQILSDVPTVHRFPDQGVWRLVRSYPIAKTAHPWHSATLPHHRCDDDGYSKYYIDVRFSCLHTLYYTLGTSYQVSPVGTFFAQPTV